jgi:hypothetical protein
LRDRYCGRIAIRFEKNFERTIMKHIPIRNPRRDAASAVILRRSSLPLGLAGAALTALASPVLAQAQQVKPPIAVYWMSVETSAGMGIAMPAMPGMAGMLPANMQGGKRMKLDLGSSQSSGGAPRADHTIPAGLSAHRAAGPSARRAPSSRPKAACSSTGAAARPYARASRS